MSYAGGLAACSVWAREWARRKGLSTKVWGAAGAAAGPLGVVAVGLWKPQAALCPHCRAPMRFEARYCPTCRSLEGAAVVSPGVVVAEARLGEDALFGHGYFESEASAA